MPDSVKISELPELTAPKSNDVIIVNDSGDNTTKKMALSSVKQEVTVTYAPISGLTLNTSDGNLHGALRRLTAGIYRLDVGDGGFTVTNTTANPINLEFVCSNSSIIGMSELGKSFVTSQFSVPTADTNNTCSLPIMRINTTNGHMYFQSLRMSVVQSGGNYNSIASIITVPANSTIYFYNGLYAEITLFGGAFVSLS